MKHGFVGLILLLAAADAVNAQERLVYIALDQPCRLLDTRTDPARALVAGEVRAIGAGGYCEVPLDAKAIEANLTVTNTLGPGYLSVMRPTGHIPTNPVPRTSVLNYSGAGQTIANAALVSLGSVSGHNWDGTFWILAWISGTDLIVDVSGYYVALP